MIEYTIIHFATIITKLSRIIASDVDGVLPFTLIKILHFMTILSRVINFYLLLVNECYLRYRFKAVYF